MRIGAMWKKTDKNGNTFYSCLIESPFIPGGKMNFNIFQNSDKKSESSPDGFIDWNNQKNNQMSDEDIPM